MAAKAGAWLGWSARDALATDVKYIEITLNAFIDHRNLVYFGMKPAATRPRVTANMFRAFAREHNTGWSQRRH